MNILEEFIERKNLKCVPAIHHCIDGLVVARKLKLNAPLTHVVEPSTHECDFLTSYLSLHCYVYMIIRWNEKIKSPGSYSVQFVSPIKLGENYKACIRHSDSLNRSFVFKSLIVKTVEYDEFESTMFTWMKSFVNNEDKWLLASTKDDAYFMLWESFVYMFDRYFADLPSHVKSALWDSMNGKNDSFSRKVAITSVLKHVNDDCRSVVDIWTRDFVLMSHKFCNWTSSIS